MDKQKVRKQLIILTKACSRAPDGHLSFEVITETLRGGKTPCGMGVPCVGLGCSTCCLNEKHFTDAQHAKQLVSIIDNGDIAVALLLE